MTESERTEGQHFLGIQLSTQGSMEDKDTANTQVWKWFEFGSVKALEMRMAHNFDDVAIKSIGAGLNNSDIPSRITSIELCAYDPDQGGASEYLINVEAQKEIRSLGDASQTVWVISSAEVDTGPLAFEDDVLSGDLYGTMKNALMGLLEDYLSPAVTSAT